MLNYFIHLYNKWIIWNIQIFSIETLILNILSKVKHLQEDESL